MRTRALVPTGAAVAVGVGVAVGLGVYGRVHQGVAVPVELAGFLRPLDAKVWLATATGYFAVLQVLSALAMYGRLPGVPPGPWLGPVHRWSGRLAFVLSVPVAVHCLYVLGFQSGSPRVLAHSLCGCLCYGAFATKMLVLSRYDGTPGWVLPAAGATVFTAVAGLWLTSALWFFTR